MKLSIQQYQQLRLFRSKGVGPVIYRKLMREYGSADVAMSAFSDLNKKYKKALVVAPEKLIDHELKNLEKLKGQLLFIDDEIFPTALKFIYDCPPILTVLGDVELLGKEQVAIVGNRQSSSAAMKFTQKISSELCAKNYVITSGLARGIDSAAHQGALSSNGKTIAVLAGGVDHIYPPENKKMYQHILETGAVVSEMPLGTVPTQNHFPRRNRIVSGLSLGTFVVEAAKRSGSLITARLASEQGREVFAMPGSPADMRSSGPNYLIQNGATMVQTVDDIIDNLPSMVTGYHHQYQEKLNLTPVPHENILDFEVEVEAEAEGEADVKPKPTAILKDKPAVELVKTTDIDGSSDAQIVINSENILSLLSTTPTPFDDLIRALGVSESEVIGILSELELEGKVERQASGLVLNSF